MLSLITMADVEPARAQFCLGASAQPDVARAVPLDGALQPAASLRVAANSAHACRRPRPRDGAVLFGTSAHVADQAKSALTQPTSQKYAHTMTRAAAIGGGAKGPHPARDPV
jgi:hypothetical protein